MGSMNAMPMMYALELKRQGYDVLYFVDASRGNTLCRPEMHYPEIRYPYPPWIVELRLPTQLMLALCPWLFAGFYRLITKAKLKGSVGCYFLNGFFVSLSPCLNSNALKIALSHGSDLDVWADSRRKVELVNGFGSRSIFKYLPKFLTKASINRIIKKQFSGFVAADRVIYFPRTFNEHGDAVIDRVIDCGGKYCPRYDASFSQLSVARPKEIGARGKLIIFSVVRFLYKTFPEGNRGYNKGNNIIIEGLAKYHKLNKKIEIHFVEKGEDVEYAKELCVQRGLGDVVVWHRVMPFQELANHLAKADVCIDQVGEHWIGAGVYAMWMQVPLIANVEHSVRAGVWPGANPVLNARTPDEVCEALRQLEDPQRRSEIGLRSKSFVIEYMNPMRTLNQIFDFNDDNPSC